MSNISKKKILQRIELWVNAYERVQYYEKLVMAKKKISNANLQYILRRNIPMLFDLINTLSPVEINNIPSKYRDSFKELSKNSKNELNTKLKNLQNTLIKKLK
tara:strand:- start:4739 stop:5047 length:309 start_codon:yes stop_codon:yes gene_type:complete